MQGNEISHLLEHNSLGVGCSGEGLLPLATQVGLAVVLVCPSVLTTQCPELAPGSHSTCLTYMETIWAQLMGDTSIWNGCCSLTSFSKLGNSPMVWVVAKGVQELLAERGKPRNSSRYCSRWEETSQLPLPQPLPAFRLGRPTNIL